MVGCLACSKGQMLALQSLQQAILRDRSLQQIHNILVGIQIDQSASFITHWQQQTKALLPGSQPSIVCYSVQCCAEIKFPQMPSMHRCVHV